MIYYLITVNLPEVTYNYETEDFTVDTSITKPLTVHGLPVATSFAVYKLNQRYDG